MFFPLAFLARDSLLSKLYIYSCARRRTTATVPLEVLRAGANELQRSQLSLRLWSRLALTLVHSVRMHYQLIHADLLRLFKLTRLVRERDRVFAVPMERVTLSINPALFLSCSASVPTTTTTRYETVEAVEVARAYSSLLLNTSMAGPAELPKHTPDRLDRRIDLLRIDLKIVTLPPKKKVCSLFGQRHSWLVSEEDSFGRLSFIEFPTSEIDISSIEAPRGGSLGTEHFPLLDTSDSRSFLIDRSMISGPTVNPALADFLSMLISITEGKIKAEQTIPYGEIKIVTLQNEHSKV
ncbi:hypothetical protein NEHOM01_0542 [Nematocida homosporus]|uniref:uncharacterized protein n=1 Tax=Nematocida homosporus TaxID=1912981 RepID=UPI00221E7661|nr:uncharacterized protein NEHOM01_0542 [Nematocida homosporus]KAI5184991.1 hypothetical protein NEHOM01_0542 [Nematocida homosporus]